MVERAGIRDILPLSPMQEGLLFHAAADGAPGLYHVQLCYEIVGALDPLRFAKACDEIVARHDALRANFVHERSARPLQILLHARPPLVTVDEGLDAESWRRADLEQPFDLARGPLIRFRLLRRHAAHWTVLLSYHHIVMDGWCSALVVSELLALYNGETLPEAPSLGAYFEWLRGRDRAEAVAYWRDALRGWSGLSSIAAARDSAGTFSPVTLSRTITASALVEAAASIQVTLPAFIAAVWGVLLARANDSSDAVYGLVVSGRPPDVPGIERMVGLFVNSVPQRVSFAADEMLTAIARRVHQQAVAASPHHHAALADVQAAAGVSPLFDHVLAIQNYPRPGGPVGDLHVVGMTAREASSFDFVIKVAPGDPLFVEIDYNPAAFERGRVEEIADRFAEALASPHATAGELAVWASVQAPAPVAIAPRPRWHDLHDPMAARVLAVWSEILDADDLAPDDNFFEVGGHSLKAMQLVSKLRRAFGVRVTVREIFAHPTAAALAALLREKTRVAEESIAPAPRRADYPLSHAQQRVWLVERLSGASATYNIPLTCICGPEVDRLRLERALHALVERHEALRTTFVEIGGEPRQIVRDAAELRIDTIDLRASAEAEDAARAITSAEVSRSFDLTRELPARVTFVLLPDERMLLLVTIHHIAADGWSLRLLAGELDALYEGETLPPPAIQYKDYAVWEQSRDLAADEAWWLARLRGRAELVRLPRDPQAREEHRFAGGAVHATLGVEATARLRALAASRQTTLSNVGLAVFFAFLHHLTGQRSLSIAVSIANRALHPELERVAGFFVNALVVHADVDPSEDFSELLGRVIDESLAAFEHQSYPFDLLVEKLRPARVGEDQPLFNVNYVFQSFGDLRMHGGGGRSPLAAMRALEPPAATAKFDLTLFLSEAGGALQLSLEYSRRLFTGDSARRYLGMFVFFLETVGADLHAEAAS